MKRFKIFLILMIISVGTYGQKLSIVCHLKCDTTQEYFLVKILCDYNLEAEFKAGERWSCDLALNREYTVIVYAQGYAPKYVAIDTHVSKLKKYEYSFDVTLDSLDEKEYPIRLGEIFYNKNTRRFDDSFTKPITELEMDKKEILDSMSIRELQNLIYEKQKEEAIKKYGTLRETEYKMSEVEDIKAESNNHLYHVVVEDGSEGWEALVEVNRKIRYDGDIEDVVEDNIVNYMIENDYYQTGDIENITVNEICRYSKPIFKIELEMINKFIEKNKESIQKVDAYIEMNRDTIRRIITSIELFEYIIEINKIEEVIDGYVKYKEITMGKDPYYPSNKVGFIMKNMEIEFDVPCLCGYYKGEGHNTQLEMSMEESYRKYLLEKYQITPESTYMGVNEMESLFGLRRDCIENNITTYDLYPLTYEEYCMSRISFIRLSTINPPVLYLRKWKNYIEDF